MRILVTGASGNLGSATCRELHAQGHDVLATDLVGRDDLPTKVHAVNLLDRARVDALVDRVDVVVHNGNHIDFSPPDPQMIFNENMTMNMNVLQAGVNAGARKLIFASSIQVIASTPRLPEEDLTDLPMYLPLDGDHPARPTNPYALSKFEGEVMLAYFSRVYGVHSIALRWPWMFRENEKERIFSTIHTKLQWTRRLGFAFLPFPDAARLIAAIVKADYRHVPRGTTRVYLPAARTNLALEPAADAVRKYFPTVPLRKPIDSLDALVDNALITRETGWAPSL